MLLLLQLVLVSNSLLGILLLIHCSLGTNLCCYLLFVERLRVPIS